MTVPADKLAAFRGPQTRQRANAVRAVAEDGLITFVLSNAGQDRHRSIIRPEGWDLTNFEKNPVVLWSHDSWSRPPVGRAERTWLDGDMLLSECRFMPRELDAFAHSIGEMYRQKFLNGVSVGFNPLGDDSVEWNEDAGCVVITKQELVEYSPVSVPSNPDALVAARSAGIDMKPLVEWAERTLDMASGPGLWVPRADALQVFQSIGRRIHAAGPENAMPTPTPTPPKPAEPPAQTRADAPAESTLADVLAEVKKLGDRVAALESADEDVETEKALDEETKALEAEAAELAKDDDEDAEPVEEAA